MKRSHFLLVFLLLCAVFSHSFVLAEEKAKPEAEKKMVSPRKAVKGTYLYGDVTSINHDAKLMTVKGWRGSATLDINNATLKGYSNLKEINPGDKVKVRYTSFGIEIAKVAKVKK